MSKFESSYKDQHFQKGFLTFASTTMTLNWTRKTLNSFYPNKNTNPNQNPITNPNILQYKIN